MKLSKRLIAIANLVPKNSIVADIGTDHGYVPGYLIEKNISQNVIGTDISAGSLEKIKTYVKELGFNDKIDIRLGNGLEVIKPNEIDTVIIAGMGGLLIKDILDKGKLVGDTISNFILQPMVAAKELRIYLINNGFEIIEEELIKEDNKYYEIIYTKKGKSDVEKEIYYEISPYLIKTCHLLLNEFIQNKIDICESIRNEIENIETEKSKEKHLELTNIIKEYKGVLADIESQGNNQINE